MGNYLACFFDNTTVYAKQRNFTRGKMEKIAMETVSDLLLVAKAPMQKIVAPFDLVEYNSRW
jgi:hypothetical protein